MEESSAISGNEQEGSPAIGELNPYVAAAKAAAGAASASAMAGVMLALKTLSISREDHKNTLSQSSGGSSRRESAASQTGNGLDKSGPKEGVPISRSASGSPSRKHWRKRAAAKLAMQMRAEGVLGGSRKVVGDSKGEEWTSSGTAGEGSGVADGLVDEYRENVAKVAALASKSNEPDIVEDQVFHSARQSLVEPPHIPNEVSGSNNSELPGLRGRQPVGESIAPEPGSPSSSGYMGSNGSSASVASLASESVVTERPRRTGSMEWAPGKRHPDEDDSLPAWRLHKKHFLVLSNAGKPIYSRYGDEHKLAGFSAILQAIISYVESSGDQIQCIRAGNHQIVFVARGPLYLVSISSTSEPQSAILYQLDLLHCQLLCLLTDAAERCVAKNSRFDMQPLLGGTGPVFSSLMHAFSWSPAVLLHAYTCLRVSPLVRQAATQALQAAASPGVMFAFLTSSNQVISMVTPRKTTLHPDDIFLLCNLVTSSESFRTSESFSPVCLPKYNPSAFLYAYVTYLAPDICLILLTSNQDSFFQLKELRAKIELSLQETRALQELSQAVTQGGLKVQNLPPPAPPPFEADMDPATRRLAAFAAQAGTSSLASISASRMCYSPQLTRNGMPGSCSVPSTSGRGGSFDPPNIVGAPGPAGLWHFMYRSSVLEQYVASEYTPPLHQKGSQKRLFRAYQHLHASVHGGGGMAGEHRTHYARDEHHVLLAWKTPEFELYAAFDPLAEKAAAIAACNRVCSWLREKEGELFLMEPKVPITW